MSRLGYGAEVVARYPPLDGAGDAVSLIRTVWATENSISLRNAAIQRFPHFLFSFLSRRKIILLLLRSMNE